MNIKSTLILGMASCAFALAANAGTLPHAKATQSSIATTSALDGVYVKAGAGFTKFGKFKETADKMSYTNKAPKSAPMFHIGVGYKFTDSLRSDLTFYYGKINYKGSRTEQTPSVKTNTAVAQKITTMAAMANAYYDFNLNDTFVPYITAGAGLGQNKNKGLNRTVIKNFTSGKQSTITETFKAKKSKISFMWNAGGGVLLNMSKNIAVDIGYRYTDFGNISVENFGAKQGGKQKIKGHQGLMSLIYKF